MVKRTGKCGNPGKLKYRGKKSAEMAALSLKIRDSRSDGESPGGVARVYRCKGGHWHITSKPLKTKSELDKNLSEGRA